MIAVVIFYLHVLGAVYAFTKGYFEHRLVDGFMAVGFVGLIFSVGWTIAGFIVRFFIPDQGFGPLLDSDSISLVIVTLLETVLYLSYFISKKKKNSARAGSGPVAQD